MEIKRYKTSAEALEGLTGLLADLMSARPGPFHLAISGGDTPKNLFKLWVEAYKDKIDWKQLRFYWVTSVAYLRPTAKATTDKPNYSFLIPCKFRMNTYSV